MSDGASSVLGMAVVVAALILTGHPHAFWIFAGWLAFHITLEITVDWRGK